MAAGKISSAFARVQRASRPRYSGLRTSIASSNRPSGSIHSPSTGRKASSVMMASMKRTPTTRVLLGMYSVRYPPMPRRILSGTGNSVKRKEMTSPTAILVSLPPVPLDTRQFESVEGVSEWRPSLYVEWTEAPQAPTDLAPSANDAVSIAAPVVRFQFTDTLGDTTLAAVQVQVATDAAFTTGVWTSAWVSSTDPQLDLAAAGYPGMAEGASVYWRAKVRDGAGLESGWSAAAQMRRVSKGTVTITNPPSTGAVLVAEEHLRAGGLGSAVAQLLAQQHPVPMAFVDLGDRYAESGAPDELMARYGLTAADVARAAHALVGRKA